MKSINRFLVAACATIGVLGLTSLCTPAHATPVFVGSYVVDNGPSWEVNPPVYSARQAAALLFGGDFDDYLISTNSSLDPSTITMTGHYDGWGIFTDSIFGQDFSKDLGGAGYNSDPGNGNAYSAYVSDHGDSNVNYVWTNDAPDIAMPGDNDRDDIPCDNNLPATPEPGSLALLGMGGLPLFGILRRRLN